MYTGTQTDFVVYLYMYVWTWDFLSNNLSRSLLNFIVLRSSLYLSILIIFLTEMIFKLDLKWHVKTKVEKAGRNMDDINGMEKSCWTKAINSVISFND